MLYCYYAVCAICKCKLADAPKTNQSKKNVTLTPCTGFHCKCEAQGNCIFLWECFSLQQGKPIPIAVICPVTPTGTNRITKKFGSTYCGAHSLYGEVKIPIRIMHVHFTGL